MIRKALGLGFMVGVASMFAFACGDDDAAGDKYPTADSFCDAKATLECAAGSVGQCGVAADACKTKRKQACIDAGNAAVGRTYTPSKAEACLNLVTGAFNAPGDKAKYTAYVDTCAHVFSGTKTKGQPCSNAYDCSGSLYCDLEKTTPLCADKSAPITENQGCANSGDVCGPGLYCELASPPLCRKRRAVGEGCGATIPCVDSAFCDNSVCKALAATGSDCTSDAVCASSFCNKDIGNKCASRPFPTENGTCKDFTP
jgi:hypothetical protein